MHPCGEVVTLRVDRGVWLRSRVTARRLLWHHRMTTRMSDAMPTAGALWMSGDAACSAGDLAALAAIAQRLAASAHEPLHCELVDVADLCHSAPDRAPEAWFRLKARFFAGGAGPSA